jgi:hydroxymethylbilane synthase
LRARVGAASVIVLPLFVSGGPHTRVDIPTALGWRTPATPPEVQLAGGRRWIYDQPLVEHAELTDLIVQLACASEPKPALRLGTRGSRLARYQAQLVADRLRAGGAAVQVVEVVTHGDRDLKQPIEALPGDAPFVQDLEDALLDGRIDLAVHSLKDMPFRSRDGLRVAAVLPRGPAGEACVTRSGQALNELPPGACVGTSSTRRTLQLRKIRPDLRIAVLRGPVDRRLSALASGRYDAIIVAAAALERLSCRGAHVAWLDEAVFVPAPGQGAIALQVRADASQPDGWLELLDDRVTRVATWIERTVAEALEGGGGTVAIHARGPSPWSAVAVWWSADGTRYRKVCADHVAAEALTRALIERLSVERDVAV